VARLKKKLKQFGSKTPLGRAGQLAEDRRHKSVAQI
jgi:hypothetical protein